MFFCFFYLFCSFTVEMKQSIVVYALPLITISNTLVFFIFSLTKMIKGKGIELFFLILLFTVLCMDLIFVDNQIFGVVIIFNVIVMLINSKYIYVEKSFYKTFSFFMFILFIYYIFFHINLGFNPNTVGFVTLLTIIYTIVFFETNKIFNHKLIHLLCITIGYIIIFETESRGALLGLITFSFFNYLVPNKIYLKKFFISLCYALATVGSLVFCVYYVSLWEKGFELKSSFSEKSFYTGREAIWSEVLTAFYKQPFIGIGSNFDLQSFRYLNIHNSMLEIMGLYGILVFILFISILWNRMYSLFSKMAEYTELKTVVIGFLSILVVGIFENTLLDSSHAFPIYFLIFIGQSIYNRKKIESK